MNAELGTQNSELRTQNSELLTMNGEQLNRITNTIVAQFNPQKIILFGSCAWDEPTEESDVDLIVIKDTSENLRDLAAEIQVALWDIPVAKDVLVRTPEQFREEASVYWTVFSQAAKHGKVLYENVEAA